MNIENKKDILLLIIGAISISLIIFLILLNKTLELYDTESNEIEIVETHNRELEYLLELERWTYYERVKKDNATKSEIIKEKTFVFDSEEELVKFLDKRYKGTYNNKKLYNYVSWEYHPSWFDDMTDEELDAFAGRVKKRAYQEVILQLLEGTIDLNKAPLTKNFKNKYKDKIPMYDDYGMYPYDKCFSKGIYPYTYKTIWTSGYDVVKLKLNPIKEYQYEIYEFLPLIVFDQWYDFTWKEYEELLMNRYTFEIVFDENENIDDLILVEKVGICDEKGQAVMDPNAIKMTREYYSKILLDMCYGKDYWKRIHDPGFEHYVEEVAMTDEFKKKYDYGKGILNEFLTDDPSISYFAENYKDDPTVYPTICSDYKDMDDYQSVFFEYLGLCYDNRCLPVWVHSDRLNKLFNIYFTLTEDLYISDIKVVPVYS